MRKQLEEQMSLELQSRLPNKLHAHIGKSPTSVIGDKKAEGIVIGDETIIFDSYNSNVDTTLQQSKTYCYGLLEPTFTLSDSYTPDIDATEFNWFVNEAKKAAFAKLKQVRDPIADERAKRGWVRSQRNREKTPANVPFYSRFNSYGRNR